MEIGVPKEIKPQESRVGLTPAAVAELIRRGHKVLVQSQAGTAIGFRDADYQAAGALIVADADTLFGACELIVKVKEPQAQERAWLTPEHCLFTYLHLAADLQQTEDLLNSGATCIAYETVSDERGGLPLLAPMSEVAGRMAIQAGAHCLETPQGGRGVLLGGVPGVPAGRVTILGAGVVGSQALAMAVGLGAEVSVLDTRIEALRRLDAHYGNRVQTLYASRDAVEKRVLAADLVIGAVLVPGAAAPKLIDADLVRRMLPGSVLVDVAIDQGGCAQTSRPTTHDAPTYVVDEVVHYCVSNMPGAVARTATLALNNATLPFVIELAERGCKRALEENSRLRDGLNLARGRITHPGVAEAHGLVCRSAQEVLAMDRG